ncbi:MAG: carboxypeptidase-like regulatory domain-containing protein [Ekhidna sp.]|nr:carboxypeptidase-like regulatory domain-containing protein [Ekhidna sp.]MBC6425364.1 carboxypeptidase-like regulatory domain-containing protein [Ekhidna sp.]
MKKIRKITLPFLITLSGYVSGQYNVTGNVVNEEKMPIPYTSVYSAEDSVGTYTDNTGAFHLSVKSLPVHLEFRNVGCKEKVLQVHSSDNLTIQLEEKVMLLDEVKDTVLADSSIAPILYAALNAV